MLRIIVAAGLLICMASASGAASFRYTSSSVSALDFHQQLSIGELYPSSDLNKVSNVVIEFETNERIKKNTTYTPYQDNRNWQIKIVGRGIRSEYRLRFSGDI